MQAYVWNGTEELGAKYDTTEIPDDLKDKAQEYHEKLVEAAAEADDDLMNKFFEDGDLSKEDIRAGVRKLTIAKESLPDLLRFRLQGQGRSADAGRRCQLPAVS